MKMANIDAVFDFMFTDPKNFDGVTKNIKFLTSLIFLVQNLRIKISAQKGDL